MCLLILVLVLHWFCAFIHSCHSIPFIQLYVSAISLSRSHIIAAVYLPKLFRSRWHFISLFIICFFLILFVFLVEFGICLWHTAMILMMISIVVVVVIMLLDVDVDEEDDDDDEEREKLKNITTNIYYEYKYEWQSKWKKKRPTTKDHKIQHTHTHLYTNFLFLFLTESWFLKNYLTSPPKPSRFLGTFRHSIFFKKSWQFND